MHHFDSLSLALDRSYSIKGTLLPLFIRVVELVSILNGFGQALPLLSIKPRDANHHGAFGRVLGHGRILPRPNVHNEGRAPLLRASLSIVVLAGAWFDSCLVEGMNRSPAAALE